MCLNKYKCITGASGESDDRDGNTVTIIGAVVGGICGTIVLVVVIVIVIYCCCRKGDKKNGMHACLLNNALLFLYNYMHRLLL